MCICCFVVSAAAHVLSHLQSREISYLIFPDPDTLMVVADAAACSCEQMMYI